METSRIQGETDRVWHGTEWHGTEWDGTEWDVLVIGAGPAGCKVAADCALRGLRTLLVESKSLPRDKVCGGCLNGRAIEILSQSSAMARILESGASRVDRLEIVSGRIARSWPVKTMYSISRWCMDPILVEIAIHSGASYLDRTTAHVEPLDHEKGAGSSSHRTIRLLSKNGITSRVLAKAVVVASGLTSPSVSQIPEFRSEIQPGARIGVGALLDEMDASNFRPHLLRMIVGKDGYVGITGVEQNRWNVAAAVDAKALRAAGSIPKLIASILQENHLPIPKHLNEADWSGTPSLTRRPMAIVSERIFAIGDAAGYVEPFTGEGMTWALQTAVLAVPFVEECCQGWSDSIGRRWQSLFRVQVRQRQWLCRALSCLLRHPSIATSTLRVAGWTPWITQRVIGSITSPPVR